MASVVSRTIRFTAPLLAARSVSGFLPKLSAFSALGIHSGAAMSTTSCALSWSHLTGGEGGSLEVVQFPCLGDNYGYVTICF